MLSAHAHLCLILRLFQDLPLVQHHLRQSEDGSEHTVNRPHLPATGLLNARRKQED